MPTIDQLVKDFLSQKSIAVSGVTRNREDAANLAYRKLKAAGYRVYAINPNTTTFDGDPCYPDLRSLPEKVDAVFIVNRPAVTEQIVRQCIELGVPRLWTHCSLGTNPRFGQGLSSSSAEVVRLCRENNIALIPGACINMFLNADFGHAAMRGILRVVGGLSVRIHDPYS
jgi:predicted CoA-binding protein